MIENEAYSCGKRQGVLALHLHTLSIYLTAKNRIISKGESKLCKLFTKVIQHIEESL